MKNHFKVYLVFFSTLLLFSTSCSIIDSVCKNGKGNVISQQRSVSAFTAVESKGSFVVNLFQNSSITQQTITISAQENIIDLIQTRISGRSLVIDTDECYTTDEKVVITIQTPALSQIVLAGSGDIILQDTILTNGLELILDGSGNIRTLPNSPIITFANCIIKLKGSGNIDLDVESTAQVNASIEGSGTIILRGTASQNSLNISGSGNIKTFALPVLTSKCEIIGSGMIELTVIDKTNVPSTANLRARISGSGIIKVKGNPTIDSDISGSGKIERVD